MRMIHGLRRFALFCGLAVVALMCMPASGLYAQFPVRDSELFEGVVLFEGEPVSDAEIFLYSRTVIPLRNDNENSIEFVTRTRQDGSFVISRASIPKYTRTYQIFAMHPGYSIGGIYLSYEIDPEHITINLHRPKTVTGTVRTASGEPIAGVLICICNISTEDNWYLDIPGHIQGHPVITDNNGRYRIEYAQEKAELSLWASKPGFVHSGSNAVVAAHETTKDIIMEPGGIIEGRVIMEETGNPVPDISFRIEGRLYTAEGRTDVNGNFRVDGVKPGRHQIIIIPDDRHLGYYASEVEPVTVVRNETMVVGDIPFLRGSIISGTVAENGTGEPIAGVPIHITAPSSETQVMFSSMRFDDGPRLMITPGEERTLGWSYSDSRGYFEATGKPGHVFARVVTDEYEFKSGPHYLMVTDSGPNEQFRFEMIPTR